VLMRARKLRFTVDWITMYLNDDGAASTVEIPKEEVHLAVTSTVVCVLVSLVFALVNVTCVTDLTRWSPVQLVPAILRLRQTSQSSENTDRGQTKVVQRSNSKVPDDVQGVTTPQPKRTSIYYIVMDSEGEGGDDSDRFRCESVDILHTESDGSSDRGRGNGLISRVCAAAGLAASSVPSMHPGRVRRRMMAVIAVFWTLALATLCLVMLPLAAMSMAQHTTPVVAQIALNTNLNEALRAMTGGKELLVPTVASAEISTSSVNSLFIHNTTENFTLFADDVLYRRTHGFLGERSLNVSVDPKDPPNVLLLVIESFRHRDSKYLVGDEGVYLMNGDANLTVTPHFDRWAARGVAFNNFWSSYRTSRSLESLQFAQLPYDSVTDSGTTGGKADVELSGLPQLFTALGYDTLFATGCRTDYDQWDAFLPSHGFDEVLDVDEFKAFAESDLSIQPQDWLDDKDGGQRRAMSYWGVHDDLSFEVLGNLMLNRTGEQVERVAAGQPKRPTFTTFYSISSHVPYWEHPKWWDDYEDKPNLSALYENATEYSDDIHRYADIRYFQDLALGKFLDRMQAEGVLNDTIVFIVGDHGQAPENGCDKYIEDAQESTTHVAAALIAEGRLGDAAGSVFTDAAQHYDLLNTLADMVGVPEGGFIQSGVGRSLLRAVPFGERVVWSNNPAKKMAAIRGTTRIE
jgi:phosphoglycerol transferase MdoB-like AlkP superfamily enzyme